MIYFFLGLAVGALPMLCVLIAGWRDDARLQRKIDAAEAELRRR